MAELEAQKRDNIPDTTQEVWFRLLKQQGWGKRKFDEQFQKVLTNPSYGAVKIDEFFNEKTSYSPEEVSRIVEQRINGMIKQGERILKDKEYGLKEYLRLENQFIKIAIANRLRLQQHNDKMEKYDEIIDRAIEIAKSEILGTENIKN
jgi:hypothetical protein